MLSSADIKSAAAAVGFDRCGIARATAVSGQRAAELRAWLAEGCHGEMDYLARNVEKRLDPRLLVEGARTIVSVALCYNPGEEAVSAEWHLARYAYGRDYHEAVKDRLRQMLALLSLEEGRDGRAFADTAPIDEKYWAEQAGIGWRGRNSQIIIPGAGSYFVLGELVLCDEADVYDRPAPNRCGTCRACLDACPGGALLGDGRLDARRCLSYLTIEHRGALPKELGAEMRGCFYGCDRCAEVCPWNKKAMAATCGDFLPRRAIADMKPADWTALTVEQYRALFKGSAVKRAKYEGLMRNIRLLRDATEE